MRFEIKLTIQEIVKDFEELICYHEKLDALFNLSKASIEDIDGFDDAMVRMAEKYISNYTDHIPETDTRFDHALSLYEILYENFREIFHKLV